MAGSLLFFRGRLLTRYPRLRKLLTHGRWPGFYVWQHGAFILSFPVLMLTGTALYFEAWHRVLIAWLPRIETAHSLLGLALAAAILAAVLGLPAAPKRPRWADWLLTGFLSLIVTLSGIALWQPATRTGQLGCGGFQRARLGFLCLARLDSDPYRAAACFVPEKAPSECALCVSAARGLAGHCGNGGRGCAVSKSRWPSAGSRHCRRNSIGWRQLHAKSANFSRLLHLHRHLSGYQTGRLQAGGRGPRRPPSDPDPR